MELEKIPSREELEEKHEEIMKNLREKFEEYEIKELGKPLLYRISNKDESLIYLVDCAFSLTRDALGRIPKEHEKFWNKVFEEVSLC